MLYIYTVKGESRAKELGFTDRKAGEPAFCGREPVTGTTAKAWEAKGYVSKQEESMKDLFAKAIMSSYEGKTILVKFKHHKEYDSFPATSFDLLVTDNAVEYIMGEETGEILFDAEEGR